MSTAGTISFTPGPALSRGLRRIVTRASLAAAAVACSGPVMLASSSAWADGEIVRQVSAACHVSSVSATYKALSSDYKLSGSCAVLETSASGQTNVDPGHVIEWAATASHQPNTKATFETMTLTLFELGQATLTGTVNSTMQCGTDPWRVAPNGPCRLVVRKTTPPSFAGYVSMAYQKLLFDAPGLPLSFGLVPAQRAALDKQYQVAMAAHQNFDPSQTSVSKPQGPGVSPFTPGGPTTSDALLSRQMPRILSPASGATVGVGQLLVKIQAPPLGSQPVSELEFTWLDSPTGQPRFVNTIPAIDTAKLVQGQYIDPKVTRLNYGRWEVRVRMIGQGAAAGPWSVPASFTLVAAQQNQSIQGSASKPPFLKTPSEALSGGTSVIRPRGLEDGPRGRSHQPADPQTKPDKQP